jgi:hypothetical protein
MSRRTPTAAQLRVLRACEEHDDGNGVAEAWTAAPGDDALAFANFNRAAGAARRRGWIDDEGQITDAGRAALAAHGNESEDKR